MIFSAGIARFPERLDGFPVCRDRNLWFDIQPASSAVIGAGFCSGHHSAAIFGALPFPFGLAFGRGFALTCVSAGLSFALAAVSLASRVSAVLSTRSALAFARRRPSPASPSSAPNAARSRPR